MRLITLTTDFGLSDWFVGTMKGVIARLAPKTRVIDITHGIPPGDVRTGAFALAASYRFFPKGTVHIAVVDPGVGSTRKAIAVQTANYFFVAPDNGVLSFALRNERVKSIRTIANEAWFLHPVSRTFHGRDIFSPVAAHLSASLSLHKLGPSLKDFTRLDWPAVRRNAGRIEGEVVHIDRFGNAITNLDAETVGTSEAPLCEIHTNRQPVCPLENWYQAVPQGKPVAVIGSCGLLEIAVNGGSAQKRLGLKVGTRIVLTARKAIRSRP